MNKLEAAKEALEAMLGVSHRLSGCSMENCHPCRENKEATDKARAALELLTKPVQADMIRIELVAMAEPKS